MMFILVFKNEAIRKTLDKLPEKTKAFLNPDYDLKKDHRK
jgi:hypothetical protein